jgi:hypothetical protein
VYVNLVRNVWVRAPWLAGLRHSELTHATADRLTAELVRMFEKNMECKRVITRRARHVADSSVLTVFVSTWAMDPFADWVRVQRIIEVLRGTIR